MKLGRKGEIYGVGTERRGKLCSWDEKEKHMKLGRKEEDIFVTGNMIAGMGG